MKKTKKTVKKNNKKVGLIGLLLIVFALVISIGTYAYYRTTITGTITGTILEWECKAGDSATNFVLTLGDLYPGKKGSWPITLSVKNFSANFTIGLDASTVTNLDNVVFKHGNDVLCKTANANDCLHTYTETVDATTGGVVTGTTTITYEWPLGEAQTENIPSSSRSAAVTVRIVCTQNNVTPYGQS